MSRVHHALLGGALAMTTLSLPGLAAAQGGDGPPPVGSAEAPVDAARPVVVVVAPSAAPIAGPGETSSGAPAAQPRPLRRRVQPLLAPSVGWTYFQQYGVPINLFDGQIAIGVAFPKGAHGVGIDASGLVAYQRGKTEMGRDVSGVGVGGEMVIHVDWLRLGFGLRVGALAAARSSSDESQLAAQFDLYGAVGVEPFAIDGMPVFFEGRVHALHWGDEAVTYSLGAGLRWCGGGCGK